MSIYGDSISGNFIKVSNILNSTITKERTLKVICLKTITKERTLKVICLKIKKRIIHSYHIYFSIMPSM